MRAADSLFDRHRRVFVLSGAGLSTASGIPDYRDREANWKRAAPIQYRAFVADPLARGRYWARSLVGWPRIAASRPNDGHRALAMLEHAGRVSAVVTQNVDGLHQRAGSREVIDLHGRLDTVACLHCRRREPRGAFQQRLADANPGWTGLDAGVAPDGDADLDGLDFDRFVVPQCAHCGGIVKPDVVFYGESVPPERLARAREWLAASDAMLVVGSSLMVLSGLRFVREAQARALPVYAINLGRTRADALFAAKLETDCVAALARIASSLNAGIAGDG